jgi:hypothetical protein
MMAVMRGPGGVVLVMCLLGVGGIGCGEVKSSPNVNDAAPDTPSPQIDAPPDVPPDAPPDGPPKANQFDVGFVNKFTIAWNNSGAGMLSFIAIANKGKMPVNLTKLSVVKVEDDDPTIDSRFVLELPSEISELATDHAAGQLGGTALRLLFQDGVMTETYVGDTDPMDFGMRFPNQSETFVGKTVNVQVTIRIGDAEAVLPISVKFVDMGEPAQFDGAARVSAR